jgi:NTP pyrophosphatase (non-canonical NTP hydrolase)
MSTFQREDRYIVLKSKDIQHLSAANMQKLQDVCGRIKIIRTERGKHDIECVVIESDWPEYEVAWALIEARVSGGDYPRRAIATAGQWLQAICHGASQKAGWWNQGDNNLIDEMRSGKIFGKALFAQKLCLIHSEVSEAMEGHRKGLMDDKLPNRPMAEVELADAVIRIFDLAGAMGYDLGGAIQEKLDFNAQRPDHKPEARQAAGGKTY